MLKFQSNQEEYCLQYRWTRGRTDPKDYESFDKRLQMLNQRDLKITNQVKQIADKEKIN